MKVTPLDLSASAPEHLQDELISFTMRGQALLLFGRNGSGKSSILRSIHSASGGQGEYTTHLIEPERAGATHYNPNVVQGEQQWRRPNQQRRNDDSQYRSRVVGRLGRFLTCLLYTSPSPRDS